MKIKSKIVDDSLTDSSPVESSEQEFVHDFMKSQILTAGAYNPNFLKAVSNKFNLTVQNVHDNCLTGAIIYAIDFFNKNTNDCFYSLPNYKMENMYLLEKK